MYRSIQILSVFLLLTFSGVVDAQTTVTCGIVDVEGPAQVEPGTSLVFRAKITSTLHTTRPEFKWKVSVGTITTGQGTGEITVDSVGLGGQVVVATVELSGAPPGCKASASRTTQVKMPAVIGCRFDNYGDIKFEDEMARLDNFAIQLSNQPESSGLILISAGKETFEREAEERLERARSYLSDVRGIDPIRIVTVDCGFSQDLTATLYIVPVGATFPECNEVNQILLSEVKFIKPRSKSSKKQR